MLKVKKKRKVGEILKLGILLLYSTLILSSFQLNIYHHVSWMDSL